MTKTYKTDLLDLRCMDCMELMAEYPDKHFDLAIVDPPYGLKELSKQNNRTEGSKYRQSMESMIQQSNSWNSSVPDLTYFNELFRVSKEQIVWGANNFDLPPSEYFCVWDKQQTIPNFASAELAWVSMNWWKKPAKVFRYQIHGAASDDGQKIHPTQKPVKLYDWMLRNYAKEGDAILDTHLGSGSHAIACHYAGLHLTASELAPDYFAASVERIKRETAQTTLF